MTGERVWGLGCLAGGVRCGVAWNTLMLALLTAAGTTLLGTLIALMAERGSRRWSKPLQVLALLPIITPPFVVGLGLILLFGRAGLVNQALEWAFGVTPSRWFYGLFGIWLAQMFAFTPVAFMIMRGVVQGISPSLEEAAQTLRAGRAATFRTVTLPLMKPGLANAFLVGFIESMADFGNPVVVGGQYSVLSTEIFFAIVGAQFDQGRAASLALLLTAFALTVFFIQQRVLGRAAYTTVSGKGDGGVPMPLPPAARRLCLGVALPWLAFTVVIYVFAFIGGFVRTWGRDYTPTLAHLITAFDLQWGSHGLVWAGTAWNSLFTTVKLAAIAAPLAAALGLLVAWLLARTQFIGQRAFEFGALLAFAIPGTVLGVSYILAFNVPPFELTGTALIIVLCFVFRNLPVGVRAGAASFKQIDKSLDEASTMLRAGTATTLQARGAAAAQACAGGGAGVQLRALDDHGVGGDLPGHRGERTGHHLHHRPRRQWRLWRRAGLLRGADRRDVAGHRADPGAGGRAATRQEGGRSMSRRAAPKANSGVRSTEDAQ